MKKVTNSLTNELLIKKAEMEFGSLNIDDLIFWIGLNTNQFDMVSQKRSQIASQMLSE